jgi:hypothetical protein
MLVEVAVGCGRDVSGQAAINRPLPHGICFVMVDLFLEEFGRRLLVTQRTVLLGMVAWRFSGDAQPASVASRQRRGQLFMRCASSVAA